MSGYACWRPVIIYVIAKKVMSVRYKRYGVVEVVPMPLLSYPPSTAQHARLTSNLHRNPAHQPPATEE